MFKLTGNGYDPKFSRVWHLLMLHEIRLQMKTFILAKYVDRTKYKAQSISERETLKEGEFFILH